MLEELAECVRKERIAPSGLHSHFSALQERSHNLRLQQVFLHVVHVLLDSTVMVQDLFLRVVFANPASSAEMARLYLVRLASLRRSDPFVRADTSVLKGVVNQFRVLQECIRMLVVLRRAQYVLLDFFVLEEWMIMQRLHVHLDSSVHRVRKYQMDTCVLTAPLRIEQDSLRRVSVPFVPLEAFVLLLVSQRLLDFVAEAMYACTEAIDQIRTMERKDIDVPKAIFVRSDRHLLVLVLADIFVVLFLSQLLVDFAMLASFALEKRFLRLL